ncbi:hypothetical protein [Phytohabitans rumicis]|uniref:Uncharacterized protein n=1 Tax=Phytohabitans rumicis TaxID=1076125 RepID=A0A6V8LFZ9_9ACTN|nr:hypothetical protein [Phytohabitans rumicis]GFJ93798.1 hypothetical protein Prum_074400 [Phytohabitans rumicis]
MTNREESGIQALLTREFSFRARPRALLMLAAGLTAPAVFGSAGPASAAPARSSLTVEPGETYLVSQTTAVDKLVIGAGGRLAAPSGYSLTLTVNGIEVGSTLESLYVNSGAYAYIGAGTYCGEVVITVAASNIITYQDRQWPFRQALYVDANGIDAQRSVLAAVKGGALSAAAASGISITSRSEAFNGVYVAGGRYTLTAPKVRMVGNGRNDFIGYGSAIVATGGSTLVVDGADIDNEGVVRDGLIADAGATMVLKNSTIRVKDGVLPTEYMDTSDQAFMMSCPWGLGMYGTVRAVNLLGANTRATFLNSTITNENWALLSVDSGESIKLVAVNCTLKHTGTSGYGTYAIGYPTEHLLGNTMKVATYATILRGATIVHYGDSSPEAVRALNDSLGLGLSAADIASVRPRTSVVKSDKFGFLWHAAGPLLIDGGTRITTEQTMFLSKAAPSSLIVDGSGGVDLKARNGVLFQLMDNDNPGRVNVTGYPWSNAYILSYVQPTAPAVKSVTFDPTAVYAADAKAAFSHITLEGDFYNAILGGGVGGLQGKNLVLNFTGATVRGVISATLAMHNESPITFDNHDQIGVVTNTAQPVVNNGVIVTLAAGSTWRVTGTSYLSRLTIDADSRVIGDDGRVPSMTVDGVATPITPGTEYRGAITLML